MKYTEDPIMLDLRQSRKQIEEDCHNDIRLLLLKLHEIENQNTSDVVDLSAMRNAELQQKNN